MTAHIELRPYGSALLPRRAPTDGVTTNASPTVTSATAAFVSSDVGRRITGTNIPANSYIGVINSGTSIGLSSSPTANTPVNATASGTGITITIHSPNAIVVRHRVYATPTDFSAGAWTPASGDVKVSIDGQAAANITTLPTHVTDEGYEYVLSAAEMTGKRITVSTVDSATKVITDYVFTVETTGDAAAMWPDPSATSPVYADMRMIAGDATAASNALNDYTTGVGYDKQGDRVLADDAITAAKIATNALDADALAADAIAEIADGVLDELLSGHTTTGSLGAKIGTPNGVAQAGAASTITLAATESSTDDIYNGRLIVIIAGTGVDQRRRITDYVGSTKVATVDLAWTTTPDTTSRYAIV